MDTDILDSKPAAISDDPTQAPDAPPPPPPALIDQQKDDPIASGTGCSVSNFANGNENVADPVADNAETVPSGLRSLVAQENNRDRLSRKRKLFALFSSYDTERLDKVARDAEAQTIKELLSSRKRPAVVATQSTKPSEFPAVVGLFPRPPASVTETAVAAKPFGKTLEDLEKETTSFHIPFESGGRPVPRSLQPFSIRFQECSIMAIARWATNASLPARGGIANNKISSFRACVDKNFRKCGLCGYWSHYERQCPHMTPVEAYRVENRIKRNRGGAGAAGAATQPDAKPPPTQTDVQRGRKAKGNNFEVCVEDCDGFLVEQRPNPRVEESNEEDDASQRNEVSETIVAGITIKSSSQYSGVAKMFVEGEVVAWTLNDGRLLAGKIESVDSSRGLAKVRCVRCMADPTGAEPVTEEVLGHLFCLPTKRLRRVRRTDFNRTDPKKAAGPRKRKTSKLKNEDGTLRSPAVLKQLFDGTYKQPRGRKPDGMEWDAKRGLWNPR